MPEMVQRASQLQYRDHKARSAKVKSTGGEENGKRKERVLLNEENCRQKKNSRRRLQRRKAYKRHNYAGMLLGGLNFINRSCIFFWDWQKLPILAYFVVVPADAFLHYERYA